MSRWKLLAESRSLLLKWWHGVSFILLLFIIIQQVTSKIAGIETIVWTWYFVLLLPSIVLLNVHAFLNKHSDKALHPRIYRLLLGLSIGFLSLMFLTFLLAQFAVEMNDYGLDVYFLQSYRYLGPLSILLVLGFVLVFYKRNNLLKPSNQAVLAIAKTKAQEAEQQTKPIRKACLGLIGDGDLTAALDKMTAYFSKNDDEGLQHLILLKSQISSIENSVELSTIESESANVSLNRITIGLIDLATNIDS